MGIKMKGAGRKAISKKGNVMIIGILFVVIVIISLIGLLTLVSNEMDMTRKMNDSARALYIAEGGVNRAKVWLTSQAYPPIGIEPFEIFTDENLGTGNYSVVIDPEDGNPGRWIKQYGLLSTGKILATEVSRLVKVILQTETFASFAYFTDNEYNPNVGAKIWFVGWDVLDGPTHSNSQINIYGSPTFKGLVSSTADSFYYYHGGPPEDNPDFQQGYTLGIENIEMPTSTENLKETAQSGGVVVSGDSTVVLNSNGTVSYSEEGQWYEFNLEETNGVMYVNGSAFVQGTLKGALTLISSDDMYVTDDVRYSTDPGDPSCDDRLGLISDKNVVIPYTAPNDLEIDAAIMALDSSLYFQYYPYYMKGTLTVYGGIIQEYRGPVGTFYASSGTKASGYNKDYSYDYRFLDTPPPYFPGTERYSQISWWEE